MKLKITFFAVLLFGVVCGVSGYAENNEPDLNDSTDIKPLEKVISSEEASLEGSSDLYDVDYGQQLPELPCSDERLKKQIENFVFSYVSRNGANSVIEQREQYLLAKNIRDFVQTDEKVLNSKDNYSAAMAVAYLKINTNKEIYKICRSYGNDSKKFADLFAVIYRQGAYYQVVIPNVMNSTKDMDKATFTFNW